MKLVLEYLKVNFIECIFIPGGTTAFLQPIDVCINKPLKNYMKNKFIEWQEMQLKVNAGSRKIVPKKEEFVSWIVESYGRINCQLIFRAFEVTGVCLDLERSLDRLSEDLRNLCRDFVRNMETLGNNGEKFSIQDLFLKSEFVEKAYSYIKN